MARTPGTAGRRIDLWTILLLAAAALALIVRVVAIAEPLGIDQSLWASAVRGMARGQRLYADVWEQRPPGIYFTYLAGFTIFGWTTAAVAWLDLAAASIVTAALFVLGRRLSGDRTGAIAAGLYAVLTIPAGLYGNGGFLERSVCETFIVACVAIAAVCAVRLRDRASVGAAIGLGVACGLAVIYKPNAGLYFPALLAWLALYAGTKPGGAPWPRVAAIATAASVIPIAGTIGWLWTQGTLADAKVAVVDFNRFYVAEGFDVASYADVFAHRIVLLMKTDAIWAAGSIATLFAAWRLIRERSLTPLAGLAVCWGAATAGVIVVNGARLFNSYFIQAFAPLCLLAAWFFTDGAGSSSRRDRVLRAAAVAAMILVLARSPYVPRAIGWSADDWRAITGGISTVEQLRRFGGYGNERGYSALANAEAASYVRERTEPDDRVFLFGVNGAGIYFLADRLTAHRFLRVNFFVGMDFPEPSFNLAAVTRDLAARRPRYILFENLHATSAIGRSVSGVITDPLVIELLSAYELEATIEDFTIYRRR
ncbi:MAG TPA: glycosyltransferase family 39 protein [Vicinamibacterales bacterium]|nr:glycosyltransferase family 39 protein [Vicinamibacterales bacterium]